MLGTVIVTGTDNDYAPVLATCPCGNANRGQDRKLEEIVMVRNGSSHHLLTYLEMRACNDAANLAMGLGLSEGHAPPQTAARLRTASVRQDQRKCLLLRSQQARKVVLGRGQTMSLLRVAVFGSPEVFHNGSRPAFALRKAQALLLYLAVEGGLHPRSKLAALLWPDSEPSDARKGLRNALALLRGLLDAADSPAAHSHLLSEHELLALSLQVRLELDLDVVQQAWKAAQTLATIPAEPQRSSLVAQVQHALSLVRGPFLDGFWLREETAFDAWHEQQQRQWQVRLQLLLDRLSSWQEAGGELEQAKATLTRWLALDPLAEEAYRRLMRVHLALGETSAALQVYASCRARLAEALQIAPSADTVGLAERIRATSARSPGSSLSATEERRPPSQLVAPLIGRAAAFSQLVGYYQLAQQGQPQAVLVMGEIGIGKTRLANEFVAWAGAQSAEVLSGHALEMNGRLPYQPLVEALRGRLEAGNAPEGLLGGLWVAGPFT